MARTRKMALKTNQKEVQNKTIKKKENRSIDELIKLCRQVTVRLNRCDTLIEKLKGEKHFLKKQLCKITKTINKNISFFQKHRQKRR